MEPAQQVVFGPFRLDPSAKRLWCGAQEVALQPQPLAVLHYLAARQEILEYYLNNILLGHGASGVRGVTAIRRPLCLARKALVGKPCIV